MNSIVGIDLGTNSIGWALRNPELIENQIEKFGVITFNKGVGNGKTGEYSFAAERTKKRSTRRLYQARKYRLWATLEHLITEGYCPLTIENLNKWRHYNKEEARNNNNGGRVYPVNDLLFDAWIKLDFNGDGKPDYNSPYQLRKELSETILDFSDEKNKMKLGRALYHIAQRRGFKSSRKSTEDVKEQQESENPEAEVQYSERKKTNKLKALFTDYDESTTIGSFLANKEKEGQRVRLDITQYLVREDYKKEIKHVFGFQSLSFSHPLYLKLVETGINKNDGSIFYKRPLRSQKGLIGKCTLEPDKYRAPISHPAFEYFRAWSFLNNIKYKPSVDGKDYKFNPNEGKKLDSNLLNDIYQKLFFRKKAYFPFSDIENYIEKKGNKWTLNYSSRTTVTGCPISARLKEIFGEDWLNIQIPKPLLEEGKKSHYNIDDIWHVLFFYEDQDYVTEFAEKKLGLDEEKTRQFKIAWNILPVGYAMLSLNAINKINKFLQKGLIYTEAVLLANLPEVLGKKWQDNEAFFVGTIGKLIDENRRQKTIISIVNTLISKHKNLPPSEVFGKKDDSYALDNSDIVDIEMAASEQFGLNKWNEKASVEKEEILTIAKDCYQGYFIAIGLKRKDIEKKRFLILESGGTNYYKGDSGYYRSPKVIDTLSEFIQTHFEVNEKQLRKIYHPSEINIYPPAKPDKDGVLKLGSPKTGSFKNPMAMRTLHELRKLLNYLIETNQIDDDTRIVVEVTRELNDANRRWAIEAWQKQREAENAEFAYAIEHLLENVAEDDDIDKMRLWYEQSDEDPIPAVTESKKEIKGIKWFENKKESYKKIAAQKSLVDKYRLWKEQECQCIYTGKIISITDLFNNNVIDFEHTIPRSISFDNSLANLTVCYADFNRSIKRNQIPYQLNNHSQILARIKKWEDKIERIKQQIDFWKTKSKKAADKDGKDDAIRQRHLWQMELNYWQNKVNRFTIKEVTTGFKNSQLTDTQLISKYALHYLKTYFGKVDVQKGTNTAVFRKIYGLQTQDEKDRSKHSHHAKDAAVLTLIPIAAKREEILKRYYEAREKNQSFSTEPYKGFKREYVWGIDDQILINNQTNSQTLTPAKRIVRKRGEKQFIEGTHSPKIATGDCIRGQLHQETFYGAIKPAKRGEKGNIERDEDGKIIKEDKIKYVLRVPFQYKSKADVPGFKTIDEIEKQIVDEGLKRQIRQQVEKAGGLKEAFEEGIYMLDKNGNKVNKIRHIRCWASISEPLQIKKHTYLSSTEYKQYYYAGNATNSLFAIYKGDSKIDYDYRNLMQISQAISTNNISSERDLFESKILITKGKATSELPLKYILKTGVKIIFLKDDEETTTTLSNKDLSNRLYVFTNFEKDGRLNLRHHLEARNKIEEKYNESEIDFDNPKPTLRFGYKKYNFLVEGYDFIISMDGIIRSK